MNHHPTLAAAASLLVLLLLLLALVPTFQPPGASQAWSLSYATGGVKAAFFVSLLPLAVLLDLGADALTTSPHWAGTLTFTFGLSLKLDLYSSLFAPLALFITWSILQFSQTYMLHDPSAGHFFKLLVLFLTAMLIFTSAGNLFQLFIGWEGVGIMSFLLISWWSARADALTAALQAVLYNRFGDAALVLSLAWMGTQLGTWEIEELTTLSTNTDLTLPTMGLLLAATGKSAQFGLHCWLPAAMEGPTPVSALLHSSTMVVAGIFLLLRFSFLLENSPLAASVCLGLGAFSSLFAATCALTQNDIKKVVAFSTSSQLGLMMVTLGLNQPQLTFLHISTHAFFKAMLFLCSGSLIHLLANEQDIRKMGGLYTLAPLSTSCMMIGTLALAGAPFLAGFFSKDAIIEALNTSHLNAWALALTLIATCFTAVYSFRLVLLIFADHPRTISLAPLNEANPTIMDPIKRLAWGSIVAGLVISMTLLPFKTPTLTMPPILKVSALCLATLGTLAALELATLADKEPLPASSPQDFSFLLGFFPLIVHRQVPRLTFFLSQDAANQSLDLAWLEKAPGGAADVQLKGISSTNKAQQGLIKTYLNLFFLTTAFLTLLCIN